MKDQLKSYVQAEIAKGQRQLRWGMVAFGAVMAILLFTFGAIRSQFTEVIAPSNLAEVAVSEVRRNLPAARDLVEKQLRAAAPAIVRYVADTSVEHAAPMLREGVEAIFDSYSRDLVAYSIKAGDRVFEKMIKQFRGDLADRVRTSVPGRYTPDAIAHELDTAMKQSFEARLESEPKESMGFKLERSVAALHNINAKLKSMAASKSPSRKEQLSKRLIATWWSVVSRSEVPENAVEGMMRGSRTPIRAMP